MQLSKFNMCLMSHELNNSLNCLLNKVPPHEVTVPHNVLKELVQEGWMIEDKHKYSREFITMFSVESLQIGCGAIVRNEAYVFTRGIDHTYTFVRQEIIRGNIFISMNKAIERIGLLVRVCESMEISSYGSP